MNKGHRCRPTSSSCCIGGNVLAALMTTQSGGPQGCLSATCVAAVYGVLAIWLRQSVAAPTDFQDWRLRHVST